MYAVTKHAGFVPSLEYFKKQVFSRNTSGYKRVRAGQFAYATIHLDEGSIGIAPTNCLISPMYTVFEPDASKVDPGYLLRFMKSPLALMQYPRFGKGTVHRRKAISLDALAGLEVPLPRLEEQRRIAAILDDADSLRSLGSRRREWFSALEEAVFRAAFANEPAAATVDEVASQLRTGPFGSQLLHSEFVDEGVAVLGLDNVVGNEFRWGSKRYISEAKYTKLQRYTVHPGDVLISIMGTTGRCVVVPDGIPLAINTKHICAVTPNSKVLPAFLRAAFLWHPASRAHLQRQTKGSIMDGLNMGIIRSMPVPVPSLEAQQQYMLRVRAVSDEWQRASQQAGKLEQLFSSLQARAFSGRL